MGCTYGADNEIVFPGTDAMLDQTVARDDAYEANLMSYIRLSGLEPGHLRTFLNDSQLDVVVVASNAPIRLFLRNHLQ